MMEPLLAKAARKLNIDQVEIRKVNAPAGKAKCGPAASDGKREYATSAFVKEALEKGSVLFDWDSRKAKSGTLAGSRVRGVGVAISAFYAGDNGYDGLFVIQPNGTMSIYTGIGNLGTQSFSDTMRVAAEMMSVPWSKVEVVWGDTSKNLPWSCMQGGSSTTFAHSRAAHAAAVDGVAKCQEIAARVLGGRPEDYEVANERVHRKGGPGMTLAEVAQKAIEFGQRRSDRFFAQFLSRHVSFLCYLELEPST